MTLEKITITDECKHIEITWDNRQYKIPMSVIKDEADLMYKKLDTEKLKSVADLYDPSVFLKNGKMDDDLKSKCWPESLLMIWYYNVFCIKNMAISTAYEEKNMIEDFKEIFASRMQFMDAYIVY